MKKTNREKDYRKVKKQEGQKRRKINREKVRRKMINIGLRSGEWKGRL